MSKIEGLSLSDELQLLEKEYMAVAMSTLASLKHSKIPTSFIHQQILNLPHQTIKSKYQKLVNKRVKALSSASIEQLFLTFSPYCDFLNPDMLEHIVDRFGDELSSTIIAMYTKRLREFRRKTVLADIAGKWVALTPPGYVELSLQMDTVWERKTLEDLEMFRLYPSRMQWFFKRVSTDRSRVVFSVPKGVRLYQDDLSNLRKNRVLHVMEGGRCVVDLGSHIHPTTELPQARNYYKRSQSQDSCSSDDLLSQKNIEDEMTFVLDKDIQFGFHKKARENVFVSQSSRRAMIVDQSRGAGTAYTARPLSGVAEFEVRLLEYAGGIRGSLKLGLMRRKANDQVPALSIPRLSEHRDNSCVWSQSKFKEKTEFQNNFGDVHLLRYYGIVNLCDLRQDDCLGLQVSAEGDLSFFVNGVSQGVAARQVYQAGLEVYCFVELMESCKAVEITRAAMKVESPTASIHEVENDHEGSSKGGETAAPQDGETAVPQDGCPDLHIATGTEISLTDTDNGDPHTQYYDL